MWSQVCGVPPPPGRSRSAARRRSYPPRLLRFLAECKQNGRACSAAKCYVPIIREFETIRLFIITSEAEGRASFR